MILVVTNKADSHADGVIRILNHRGVPVLRFNTENLLNSYSATLACTTAEWAGHIRDRLGRVADLGSLRTAWLRKPVFDPEIPGAGRDRGVRKFVAKEAKAFVEGVYALPGPRWINDPFCADRSKNKFQQLLLAKKLGIHVPDTIISMQPSEIVGFSKRYPNGVIVKSVYTSNIELDGINVGILSRKLTHSDVKKFSSGVRFSPTLLQEYCEKDFEVRVIVVDSNIISVKIFSQDHADTQVDWRFDPSLCRHELFDLPEEIKRFCFDFLSAQGLSYGAIDLIVSPEGRYTFLENNPYGNFQWLDDEAGARTIETVANVLIKCQSRDLQRPVETSAQFL